MSQTNPRRFRLALRYSLFFHLAVLFLLALYSFAKLGALPIPMHFIDIRVLMFLSLATTIACPLSITYCSNRLELSVRRKFLLLSIEALICVAQVFHYRSFVM